MGRVLRGAAAATLARRLRSDDHVFRGAYAPPPSVTATTATPSPWSVDAAAPPRPAASRSPTSRHAVAPPGGAVQTVDQIGSFDEGAVDHGDTRTLRRPGLLLPSTDRVRIPGHDGAHPVRSGEQGPAGLGLCRWARRLRLRELHDNDGDSRVDEYADGAGRGHVDPAPTEVLANDQPYRNYNGGHVVFGPDGYLYVGYGDGAGGDPQRPALDLAPGSASSCGSTPAPTAASRTRFRPTTPSPTGRSLPRDLERRAAQPVAVQLRPRRQGDLWIGDVGQTAIEEIDLGPAAQVPAGASTSAGARSRDRHPSTRPPGTGPLATDLRVPPRGRRLLGRAAPFTAARRSPPSGARTLGDYCARGITALVAQDGRLVDSATISTSPARSSGFCTDGAGEIYVVSIGGGVFRLDPA